MIGQNSYGEVLDKQLAKLPRDNLLERVGMEIDAGITQMFGKGRAEFALIYPLQLIDYPIDLPMRSYELQGVKPYMLGYVMCNKTAANQWLVERINQRLRIAYKSGEFATVHTPFVATKDKPLVEMYVNQMLAELSP